MWRVVIVTIMVLVVLAVLFLAAFLWGGATHERAVKEDGHAGLEGAQLLRNAAVILKELAYPSTIDTNSFLSSEHHDQVDKWLTDYTRTGKGKR